MIERGENLMLYMLERILKPMHPDSKFCTCKEFTKTETYAMILWYIDVY